MELDATLLLAVLLLGTAVVYSAVGQAGGTGYLAVMALFGLSPAVMRPSALVLNVLVAAVGTLRYARAGLFSWRSLWPFLLGSAPLAMAGGAIELPGSFYRPVVGAVLLVAAVRLAWTARGRADPPKVDAAVPIAPAVAWGATIGLLSGLTGVGGGIFLSPLLLTTGWAEVRRSGGVSAGFILVNSAAALAGNVASVRALPAEIPLWAGAAIVGGLVGTELGTRRLATPLLRLMLVAVLVIAAMRLLIG